MGVEYGYTRLGAQDELPERPFTDVRFNYEDSWAMNLMTYRLRDLLNAPDGLPDEACPLKIDHYEPDGRYLRAIICNSDKAVFEKDLVVVGFFGQRRPYAARTDIVTVDDQLVAEFTHFPQVVAYLSLQLDGDNYGNIVLLANDGAREHWRESRHHQFAVAEIAPDYYSTVRLHNGLLPDGLLREDPLVQLTSTKYFDYQDGFWCGLRQLHD